jgi:hypothetical protein
MAQSLTLTGRRRIRYVAITAVLVVVFGWVSTLYAASLRQHEFLDGWVLAAGMIVLAGYNIRKKIPMLAIGRASTWTQIHIYLGFFSVAMFLFHTDFAIPIGALIWALWTMFVLVVLSGFIGLYLSISIPPKLEHGGEQVLLERIPGFRAQLAREVEDLAMRSVADEASLTIFNFYTDTLHHFMGRQRNWLDHLRGSPRQLSRIRRNIENLRRYLDPSGTEILREIEDCVVAKDNLDFRYANLMVLRLWLFVHIPATYSLIILAIVHVATVYAYSSGAP